MTLLAVAHGLVLVALHGFGHDRVFGIARLFHLDREGNAPTWFSSMALLVAASLLGVVAHACRQAQTPYARHWTGLALVFIALSLDEAASIHEISMRPLREALHAGGVLYFAWVVPATVFVAAMALAYLRFIRDLPAPTRRGVLVAAILYVGGALGMEFPGGWIAEAQGSSDTLLYHLVITVEELLEMAGMIVFIRALASHIAREWPEIRLRFSP